MTDKRRARMWRTLDAAHKRLVAVIPDPSLTDETDFAPVARKVIDALRGMGGPAWVELDEKSGWRDFGPHFSLVRRTRNHPTFGPELIRAVHASSNTLTLTFVTAELARIGVTVRRTGHGGEVVVRCRGAAAGGGYFTDRLADALDTGRAMAGAAG